VVATGVLEFDECFLGLEKPADENVGVRAGD
jgi:hypothetical protein